MFFSSLLLALSAVVSAKQELLLKVSAPASVSGIENLQVTTTVINTGDVVLKILNAPISVLHEAPTDTFAITHDSTGNSPSFTGILIKYVPSIAAKYGNADAFTTLAPGGSVVVKHDLSTTYNFTSSGAGKYTVSAYNQFHILDNQSGVVTPLYATIHSATSTVISGTLAKADLSRLEKTKPSGKVTPTFVGCTQDRKLLIEAASASAQAYQVESLSYLKSHLQSTQRYVSWFGNYTAARHTTVQDHFTKIGTAGLFAGYTYDCTCPRYPTAYAYVSPGQFGYVYLCGAFWRAPNTGTDSKAGTLIHESSHFYATAGTKDNAYGQAAARGLAINSPADAIANADSHEYFSENSPFEV